MTTIIIKKIGFMTNKKIIFVLFLMIILDFIGFSLIFPLVPDLLIYYFNHPIYSIDFWFNTFIKSLHMNFFEYKIENIVLLMGTFLGSLYSFLQFLFSSFWGKTSDKLGRKKVLLITNTGIAISYLIWLFSNSFIFFIFSRIINGIMAGNLGVISAYISDISNEKNRTSNMGIMGMAIGLGFVIGPAFGGIFYQLGKILSSQYEILKIFHPFYLCSFGSFLLSFISVLLNIFFLKESHKESTNKDFSLRYILFNQDILKLSIVNFVYMLIFTSFEFTFTFFYKFKYLLNPTQMGYLFFYMGILVALSQGIIPRFFSKKLSDIQMIRIGTFLVSFTFLFQLLSNHLLLSILSLIPLAIGNSFVQPAIYGFASKISEEEKKGFVLGSLRSLSSISRAISPLTGGIIYWFYGYKITYFLFFFIVLFIYFLTIIFWLYKK